MAESYKWSKKQLKDAASQSNGTLVSLAKILGCKSVLTAQRWIKKYPEIEAVFNEKKSQLIDVAENTLYDCLHSPVDSVRLKAAEFVLKTVGRDTYGEHKDDDTQAKLVDLVDKLINKASE
jgi:hypothetical protein